MLKPLLLLLITITIASSLEITAHYPADKLGDNVLYLRGSSCGLNWRNGVEMKRDETSENLWHWHADCDSDTADNLEMKLLLNDDDSKWMVGANAVCSVKDASVDIYPWFGSSLGRYTYERGLFSPQLNNSRDISIWLPPSYDENYLKPMKDVLIMHDGNNLFDPNCPGGGCCPFGCWKIQDTLGPMIVEGAMREIMIIGVYNTPDRDNELTYSFDPSQKEGGKGDLYLDFVHDTVCVEMKKRYPRIQTDTYGMLGSSLGGLISCYAGFTRPSLYTAVGCMSSSFWWNSQDFNGTVIPTHATPLPEISVYLDTGDDALDTSITVRDTMLSVGFNSTEHSMSTVFYYYQPGGQHNEQYWGERFHVPMELLYGV